MKRLLVVFFFSSLAGCGTISTYVNRDANENKVRLQNAEDKKEVHDYSVISFTANRRAMIISKGSPANPNEIIFCAEPPPDAATSILASDNFKAVIAKSTERNASIDVGSAFNMLSQGIAQRTPMVEVYRASVFSLCQLFANKAINATQAGLMFESITNNVINKIDPKPGSYPSPVNTPPFDSKLPAAPAPAHDSPSPAKKIEEAKSELDNSEEALRVACAKASTVEEKALCPAPPTTAELIKAATKKRAEAAAALAAACKGNKDVKAGGSCPPSTGKVP